MRLFVNIFSGMEVCVIRHTPVAIGNDVCYGQYNVPLSDSFKEDVKQLKAQMSNDYDAVYSSPLLRCKVLAFELGFDKVEYKDALKEMNFGEWENMKWNDINQENLNNWMLNFVNEETPNGESLQLLYNRVKLFFDELRMSSHKKILIITHAGVIRCIWAYLLDIPLENIFKLPVGHHELFICNLTDNKVTDSIERLK
jgi:alpha-ribazole phosphatase